MKHEVRLGDGEAVCTRCFRSFVGSATNAHKWAESHECPPLLEKCVCGEHSDCPDGWHYGDDLPCSCTPDCVLEDEDETK